MVFRVLLAFVVSSLFAFAGFLVYKRGKTLCTLLGIILMVCAAFPCVFFISSEQVNKMSLGQQLLLSFSFIIVVTCEICIPLSVHTDKEKKKKAEEAYNLLQENIVKTKYIDSSHIVTQESKTSTGSALGRAIVGDLVAGSVGAIVGSATAKEKVTTHEKHTTTFMVYYKDGQRQHQTVNNGTALYNLYMEKLDLD